MNNEHLAAQSGIKNPRELKPPGGEAGMNASHDPETNAPSHSDSTSPKKIFVCSPYRPLAETEESRKVELESNLHRAKTACRNTFFSPDKNLSSTGISRRQQVLHPIVWI